MASPFNITGEAHPEQKRADQQAAAHALAAGDSKPSDPVPVPLNAAAAETGGAIWQQWKALLQQTEASMRVWKDKQLSQLGAANREALQEYAKFAAYLLFVFLVKAVTIAVLWNSAGREVLSGERVSVMTVLAVVLILAMIF